MTIPDPSDAEYLEAALAWAENSWHGTMPRALHDYIVDLEVALGMRVAGGETGPSVIRGESS